MTNEVIHLKSYAKINLYLDIGDKLENGYHYVETILQTIDLYDKVQIKKLDKPFLSVHCNHPEVPIGKDSMVVKAVETIMKDVRLKEKQAGFDVSIYKNIPIASGLGGGSSNIATIILGICHLMRIKKSETDLINLVTNLGMDIPFFMKRKTVYARGRGEILFPLIPIEPPINLLLVNPGIKISTKWAYQAYDQEVKKGLKKAKQGIHHFLNREKAMDLYDVSQSVYNRFNPIIMKKYSVIKQIKKQLIEMGSLAVSISGSGPTVFGIFENQQKTKEAYFKMKNQYPFVFKTNTVRADHIFL